MKIHVGVYVQMILKCDRFESHIFCSAKLNHLFSIFVSNVIHSLQRLFFTCFWETLFQNNFLMLVMSCPFGASPFCAQFCFVLWERYLHMCVTISIHYGKLNANLWRNRMDCLISEGPSISQNVLWWTWESRKVVDLETRSGTKIEHNTWAKWKRSMATSHPSISPHWWLSSAKIWKEETERNRHYLICYKNRRAKVRFRPSKQQSQTTLSHNMKIITFIPPPLFLKCRISSVKHFVSKLGWIHHKRRLPTWQAQQRVHESKYFENHVFLPHDKNNFLTLSYLENSAGQLKVTSGFL